MSSVLGFKVAKEGRRLFVSEKQEFVAKFVLMLWPELHWTQRRFPESNLFHHCP